MVQRVIYFMIFTALLSCKGDQEYTQTDNLYTVKTDISVEAAVTILKSDLEQNGLTIFNVIDHSAQAQEAGLDLKPITLIIFGNPEVGTKLMQCDPRMGIELPLKLIVWQGSNSLTYIGFWPLESYINYYEMEGCEEILSKVTDNVKNLLDKSLKNR